MEQHEVVWNFEVEGVGGLLKKISEQTASQRPKNSR